MRELASRHRRRIQQIQDMLVERGLGPLWVEPSVSLKYLTGLDLVSLERTTGLIIPPRGELRMVTPLLLRDECKYADIQLEVWSDGEGPDRAIARALAGISELLVQSSLTAEHLFILREARPDIEIRLDPGVISRLRQRKDPDEIDALSRAASAADELVEWIGRLELNSFTESQLARRIQAKFLELGSIPSQYAVVASGENSALPHYIGTDVNIRSDLPLLFDFGCSQGGYWSDITRVYFPGERNGELEDAYSLVCDAYDAAFGVLEPGIPCRAVDQAARVVIEKAGFGDRFLHRTGHGIGLEVHEAPYLTPTNAARLEVGHVFTIEPGIYIQGRFGVRFENVIHLGQEGPEPLNRSPREHFFNTPSR